MSEEKKDQLLSELSEILAEAPEKYREEVARALIHDASVTTRAIRIAEGKSA